MTDLRKGDWVKWNAHLGEVINPDIDGRVMIQVGSTYYYLAADEKLTDVRSTKRVK